MEDKKRTTLADLTNTYNLIPISTLHELVAASSNPKLLSKPPVSILKSVSSSTNKKLCSDASNRSDASIGSSNVNSARHPRAVQFRNPSHLISSTTNLGGSRNRDAAHRKRQTTEKDKKGETDVLIVSPTLLEKRKDKGKAIAVPFSSSQRENDADVLLHSSTSVEKRKEKGKAIAVPFDSLTPEREADVLIFGPTHVEKRKDKGKAIEGETDVLIVSPTPLEKRKDKGKAIAVPFSTLQRENGADVLLHSSTSVEKRKEKGKAIAVPFDSLTPEREGDVLIFGPTHVEKRKDKGKAIDASFSLPPYEDESNVQPSSPTPVQNRMDKGKAIAMPSSLSTHESEVDVLVISPDPVEKRKDKGKAIAAPFSLSTSEPMKVNCNGIYNPYIPLERKVQQDKASFGPFTSGFVEKMDNSGKQILKCYSRSYKKAEKGNTIVNSSASSMGAREVKEKGTINHSSCQNERRNDEDEGIAGPSVSSITKRKERGKEFVIPPIERAKESGKHLNLLSSSLKKAWDRGNKILQPFNTIEKAKDKESSGTLAVSHQPPRRKREKGKNDAGASSCPPMRRTKNLQNDVNEVGEAKSSNAWTDPGPKSRKKRRPRSEPTSEVPQDYIEKMKAHFKEVDDFELPVEEVSEDEID